MNPTRASWPLAAALTAIAAAFACGAAWLLWTTFMAYDDEGYVLWSLQEFAAGGKLYTEVYSQYGPFFFLFHRALHAIGLDFTNTTARALTWFYWIGTATLCAALVWRQTRSSLATFATYGAVFVHLWPMIAEPSHPGGFICFLVAAIAFLGAESRLSPTMRSAGVAVLAAAIALTKINVGVFLFASIGGWWLLGMARLTGRAALAWLGIAALVLLPVALIRDFSTSWMRTFVVLNAVAAATVGLAARTTGITVAAAPLRLGVVAVAAGVVTGATLLAIVAAGTSASAVVDGVILGPLRHPSVFALPFTERAGSLLLAVISLGVAVSMSRISDARRTPFIVCARLAAVAAYILCALQVLRVETYVFTFSYGLSLAWLLVLPAHGGDRGASARAWLALLLVPQALHAFPVAGSQMSWGTFLWVPLAALALHDSLAFARVRTWPAGAGAAVAAAIAVAGARYTQVGWDRFQRSDALNLPGARHIRVPEDFASGLRVLSRNATAHADVLFTAPGMQSFHLWTGVPPPTKANATHWFTLLSREQQGAIQQRLAASPRAALIFQRHVWDTLHARGATETPLAHWLHENFEPAFRVESYEFWIRKDRRIAAVGTAQLLRSTSPEKPGVKLEIIIAAEPKLEIATVELRNFTGNGSQPIVTWTTQNAAFAWAQLGSDGRVLREDVVPAHPFAVHGLARVDLYTREFPPGTVAEKSILYLRDSAGRKIAEARLLP